MRFKGIDAAHRNAMNTNSLVMNRFRCEVESHSGLIETALALGADSTESVAPYVTASLQASLIPALDSLRSVGSCGFRADDRDASVWCPRDLCSGLSVCRHSMIFSSSGLTALMGSLLIRGSAFSPAEQLTLRPRQAT